MHSPIPTEWLLSTETPAIRYRTLVDWMGVRKNSAKAQRAWREIQTTGPVPAILARQRETGAWKGESSFYSPKYKSSHWSMMLLAELGADPRDARFRLGARQMLAATASRLAPPDNEPGAGWSCLWGNMLRYAALAGELKNPQAGKVAGFLAADLQTGPSTCRYNGGRPCAWGAARSLWGLAALPEKLQTKPVRSAIRAGARFLLEDFHLEKADYPNAGSLGGSPFWFRLNFPLFYQVDILFVLRVLGELGLLREPGAQPALDWLESKRRPDGRFRGTPFPSRTLPALGGVEEASRWVTLHAWSILRQAGRK